jgi:CubicO group peptidase (beta-lactamase class C family)
VIGPDAERVLARIVADSGAPAAAVAVVRDGVPALWTFGATPRTAFDVGSCSKSYVATAVALLVGDGTLAFDDPVQRHLPELVFDEDWITHGATIRDLLANRVGLKRQIPVESLANPELSALEILKRVRHLDRVHPFRSGYVYFNPGFMACRLIVERVSGLPYGEFLERRLFQPLGMAHSASGAERVARLADRARGHTLASGTAQPVDDTAFDNWQGAAGVHSCAEDAVRWLGFQLGGGAPLLAPALLAETHQAHTPMPRSECKLIHCPPEAAAASYCLGWWTTMLHGHRVVQHAGEMFGWRAHHALVPDARLGVSVMLAAAVPRHAALAYTLLETALTGASRDWCAIADALQAEQNAATTRLLEAAFPPGDDKPLALAEYAGTYAHRACGKVDVRVAAGALEMQFRDGRIWDLRLEPLGGHVFSGRVLNPSVSDYVPVPTRARFLVEKDRAVALTDPNATYRRDPSNI